MRTVSKAVVVLICFGFAFPAWAGSEVIRKVSPAACMPQQQDYAYMWWAYGWEPVVNQEAGKGIMCFQTGRFGMAMDMLHVKLLNLGHIKKTATAGNALTQDNSVIFNLPQASLDLSIIADGKKYHFAKQIGGLDRAVGETAYRSDFPVKMVESGSIFQRVMIMNLRFADEQGTMLKADSRLEISIWPDRVSFVLVVTPEASLQNGSISIAVKNTSGSDEIAGSGSSAIKPGMAGQAQSAAMTIVMDEKEKETPTVDIIAKDVKSGAPVQVEYRKEHGWYYVALPNETWSIRKDFDHIERVSLRIQNPENTEQVARLMLAKDYGFEGITGMTPMLRDKDGRPTDIPVQLSKNWHGLPNRVLLYQGSWFHGMSLLRLPAKSEVELEFTMIYCRWGGVMIGDALAVALFARLWRRMGVLTDIEFIECRYSGKIAGALRFWAGTSSALIFCPLIIGWVIKAMETISRETMGLPPQYKTLTTIIVICVALAMCTLSGLWGIVFADFFLFIVATLGTTILAILSVRHVGGLHAMVTKLSAMQDWSGHALNIAPSIGSGVAQMSVWNAIGYFGILWIMVAVSGGYQAQRLLACKDSRHATFAILMHSIVYYAVVCWPWIIVGLCSLIVFPTLGEGVSNDSAYPRMIVAILPIGMRGVLVAALVAAFISTISTMFNWGSSYLVNDVYKRFCIKDASAKHYIWVARIATVLMATGGGIISYFARDIQQLLTIFYVVGSGMVVIAALRWFWWRLNAAGDLAATLAAWIVAPLLLFGKVFDAPARVVLGLDVNVEFSTDPNLIGARMLFMAIAMTGVAIIVSYCTAPTDMERLKDFVVRAKPFRFFWRPVVRHLSVEYREHEGIGRTLISWLFAVACVGSLIFGVGKLLLGSPLPGVLLLCMFVVLLYITIRRINADFADECAIADGKAKSEAV